MTGARSKRHDTTQYSYVSFHEKISQEKGSLHCKLARLGSTTTTAVRSPDWDKHHTSLLLSDGEWNTAAAAAGISLSCTKPYAFSFLHYNNCTTLAQHCTNSISNLQVYSLQIVGEVERKCSRNHTQAGSCVPSLTL